MVGNEIPTIPNTLIYMNAQSDAPRFQRAPELASPVLHHDTKWGGPEGGGQAEDRPPDAFTAGGYLFPNHGCSRWRDPPSLISLRFTDAPACRCLPRFLLIKLSLSACLRFKWNFFFSTGPNLLAQINQKCQKQTRKFAAAPPRGETWNSFKHV